MRTVTKAKKNKKPVPKLLQLFLSCLYISAFTFGGGFVIVTFMKKKFVDQLHWIDDEEMLDLAALAQSGPGAIAVNAAIMVGWRIDGFIGMLVAVLGTIIPPMAILSVISLFYKAFASNRYVALVLRGMQSGVAAVIFDVVVGLGQNVIDTRNVVYYLVMAAAFAASVVLKVNVIYIILAAAALGLVLALIEKKTGKTKTIALNKQIIKALRLYFPYRRSAYLFANNRKDGHAICRVQAWRIVREAAEAVGVQGKIACHSLRKTFGYQAWKSQAVSPVVLMEIYNHSSYAVTKRYLGVAQDDLDKAYLGMALF